MFFNINYYWLEWMNFYDNDRFSLRPPSGSGAVDDREADYEIELIELNPTLKPVAQSPRRSRGPLRDPSDYTAVITSKDPPESSNLLHLLSSNI